MIDQHGRRVRARVVRTPAGTTHVEYRLGTDRYHSLDALEAALTDD